MKTAVIIPAAGEGKRFGASFPKQYMEIGDIAVIARTIRLFEEVAEVEAIVIAVHPEWRSAFCEMAERYELTKIADIVEGGAERQDSIANALKSPAIADAAVILVHDAVRPFASADLIRRVIYTAEETGAAVPVLPLKDAVKRINEEGMALQTLNRDELRAAQTPQGFRAEIIRRAYSVADRSRSYDDASLAEAAGFAVSTIKGEDQNIKITAPFDWMIAQLIAARLDQGI